MAEPEDLIIDGALVASRVARDVWRRYAPAPVAAVVRLADVRVRIECFLHGLFERPIAVTAAAPEAPVSWLARLAGRAADRDATDTAGTDGLRVYLPSALDAPGGEGLAIETYLLLATEQASRLVRGSISLLVGITDAEVRDHFLFADAVAVDRWIACEAPGLVPALRAARRDALGRRTGGARPRIGREQLTEERLRALLASDPRDPFDGVPACATASDALVWATTAPDPGSTATAYRSIAPTWYWGRLHAPAPISPAAGLYSADDSLQPRLRRQRVAEMRRRPRIRDVEEDEDDHGTGLWVIRPDEPQESVEDPFGLQRPADRADDADPDGLGDSLAELPEARVVRTHGQAKEVLRAGDEVPRAPGLSGSISGASGIAYPEWDFRSATYHVPGAVVRESAPALGDPAWAAFALERHSRLVRRVRARFTTLRPRRVRLGRQSDGPELDIGECVRAAADACAGAVAEDRLYVDVRPARGDLAVALLVDVSASTDSWVSGTQRIVDVEKDALLVVCEALSAFGDRHAVIAFAGEGPDNVSICPVKRFSEGSGDIVRRRIAALEADGYTRIGAAMRHTTAALNAEPAGRRLLLLLSDGKPNDVDAYDGPYGIEDARQAAAEARAQGVRVFCLTVDREAPRYAHRIFGAAGFAMLRRPDQLPDVLIEVLRRLIRS
jgi:nitric oxide reductase NorD protein